MAEVKIIGQMDNTIDHTFESANRVYDKEGLCPTLPTCAGGNIQPKIIQEPICIGGLSDNKWGNQYHQQDRVYSSEGLAMCHPANIPEGSYKYYIPVNQAKVETQYRIRKLTPRECWRLMGYTDTDFDKAAYKKDIYFLEGDKEKCNANLKVVTEKQKLTNTETYVLCTISDTQDMEILKIIKKLLAEMPESEKMQNVSFAIEQSEKKELSECVTNTTKCIDFMGMQCTLTEGKGQLQTVIIVQGKKDKGNTAKFMKITTESNLNQSKLYTILILTEQIMKLRIFGSTTQKANIQGSIAITDVCENYILLKVSGLKMENTSIRVSSSQLYKQAGNAIVKQVLMAIFSQML